MNTIGIDPKEDAPSESSVLSGSPRFKSWNLDETADISSGI
jgi:hypothetical protein